jgi:hypothetical protein
MALPAWLRAQRRALTLVALALPATAAAQTSTTISPTTPAHPSLPWSGITTPQGQLIRYIYVAPQPVTLEYVVPGPEAPPAVEPAPPDAAEGEPKSETRPPAEAKAPAEAGTPAVAKAPADAKTPGEAKAPAEAKAPEEPPPAESAPAGPQIVRQIITVPGYYVRETTVGFLYPERWAIEPAGPNLYRWRQIPPQFVPK